MHHLVAVMLVDAAVLGMGSDGPAVGSIYIYGILQERLVAVW